MADKKLQDEELKAMGTNGIEALDDSDLDKVAGGMILDATGLPECVPGKPWEVIHNNTGEVLSRWGTQAEACWAAKQYNSGSPYDAQIVSIEEITYLRNHPQIPQGTI